jgi:hypothetical protein
MDEQPIAPNANFGRLQAHLMALLAAIEQRFGPRSGPGSSLEAARA